MADVSHVPDEAWALLESALSPVTAADTARLPIAVVDCLRPLPHTSHFGLAQAVSAARRLRAARTYITGMGHEVAHEEYARVGEVLGDARAEGKGEELTPAERWCLDLVEDGPPLWIRPAHDGLRVVVDGGAGAVHDGTYDS
jgi:hypothetical protein